MNNSDQVLSDAKNALVRQQYSRSIGTNSQILKRQHRWKKLGRIALAAGAVLVGAGILGAIIDGIGILGVMATALVIAGTTFVFGRYPKMKIPSAASLRQEDLGLLAGKTEIWLESQRPMLPAPAVQLLDGIGMQLDALAPQLQSLDPNEPAAREVRKLVGEHLPELIASYRRVPSNLRDEERNGRSPDQQLVDGLGVIRTEIATMTRQLAEGDMDKLATRGRYLEIKYQGDGSGPV